MRLIRQIEKYTRTRLSSFSPPHCVCVCVVPANHYPLPLSNWMSAWLTQLLHRCTLTTTAAPAACTVPISLSLSMCLSFASAWPSSNAQATKHADVSLALKMRLHVGSSSEMGYILRSLHKETLDFTEERALKRCALRLVMRPSRTHSNFNGYRKSTEHPVLCSRGGRVSNFHQVNWLRLK